MKNNIEDLKFALENQDRIIADAQNVRNQIEAVIVKMEGKPGPTPPPEPTPEPQGLKIYPWIRQTFEKYGVEDNLFHYDVHEKELEVGRTLTLTVVVADGEPPTGENQVTGVPVIFQIGSMNIRKFTGKDGGGNTSQQGFTVKAGLTEIPVWIEGEKESTLFTYKIIGKQDKKPVEPEQPPSNPAPSDPPPSTPPAPGTGTQVLMMFMQADKPNLFPPTVDFALNGKWYRVGGKSQNDSIWNVKMSDANGPRGLLVNLDGPLTHLEFNPEQIKVPGLNLWDFGWWNFKILRKDPNANLASPTFSSSGGINFWGNSNGAGRLVGAGGYNTTVEPNKTFYKFSVPASYNTSGKIAIFCNSHGMNNPAFQPFGPNEW